MSAPKPDDCVELVAVHRDGTVERWAGDVATRVWAACDWSWLDKSEKPTVTNPYRRVTEVEGVIERDLIGMHYVADENGCSVALMDRMFPTEVNLVGPRNGRKYRLRFDVTAVPVPEVKP